MSCRICDKDLSTEELCDKCRERREKVQQASKDKGHCVCTVPVEHGGFACPCELFSKFNICHCAKEDERLGVTLPSWFIWPKE